MVATPHHALTNGDAGGLAEEWLAVLRISMAGTQFF